MSKQPSADDQATASRITTLRKARGLSQTAVANVLGVTFQQVQKYERGTNRISPDRLAKLAALFEVPVSVLFDEATDGQFKGTGLAALHEFEGADELVRAYVAIQDPAARREVLALVRTVARLGSQGSKPPLRLGDAIAKT